MRCHGPRQGVYMSCGVTGSRQGVYMSCGVTGSRQGVYMSCGVMGSRQGVNRSCGVVIPPEVRIGRAYGLVLRCREGLHDV
eukprot:gene15678-biopygen23214